MAAIEGEAVMALGIGGSEEAGDLDASGDGATDFAAWFARQWEVDVVYDPSCRLRTFEELRHQASGVGGGIF